jgi:hypothetical protein
VKVAAAAVSAPSMTLRRETGDVVGTRRLHTPKGISNITHRDIGMIVRGDEVLIIGFLLHYYKWLHIYIVDYAPRNYIEENVLARGGPVGCVCGIITVWYGKIPRLSDSYVGRYRCEWTTQRVRHLGIAVFLCVIERVYSVLNPRYIQT